MKRKRFTEEQIIAVLREHEAGAKAGDLARKHGVSEATLYNWKAKYGGMDVSDAKRLKALEDENAKLKKLLADQILEAAALKELLSKMYDLPRPGKDRFRSDDGSPPKCIRPLASGPLLRSGHDEIRAHGSQKMVRAGARFFAQSLQCADRLFRHHYPEPRFLQASTP
jgi:putative transposase